MTDRNQYQVTIGPEYACDWGWQTDHPGVWTESDHEGVRWFFLGGLTELGRRALLKHFQLEDVAHEYPLGIIIRTGPAELVARRRALEKQNGLEKATIISDLAGYRIPPEALAA